MSASLLTSTQTTLVLDALNECSADGRMELVAMPDEPVRSAALPVKVIDASRFDRDIRESFDSEPNVSYGLQGRHGARPVAAEITKRRARQCRTFSASRELPLCERGHGV